MTGEDPLTWLLRIANKEPKLTDGALAIGGTIEDDDGGTMTEKVNHPSHYNLGEKDADGTAKYEVIKAIEGWSLGFKLGNALKYIVRAPHKGTQIEDLKKARWYLERAVTHFEMPVEVGSTKTLPVILHQEAVVAWGLPPELADVVFSIRYDKTSTALANLDAYIARISAPPIPTRD